MGTSCLCSINAESTTEHCVMTSTALSDRLNVSDSYLKKIIKALVKEGLVNSTTGKHGGFSLKTFKSDHVL